MLDGRYRVIEPIAEGAMGVVYRAERVRLGRIVAIKVLHDELPNELSSRKRFEIEAVAMAKLEHPHCASVLDVGIHEDRPYVVMDFVSGENLKEVIAEGPLPIPRAVEIVRQVLSGLAHAHEHGIIHRDIKPANIVLSQKSGLGDHVKILDFGLARLNADQSMTTGVVVGTPSYMAPEQIRGVKIDHRADLYACGVLLFELLTSKKPFQSAKDDPIEVCSMHLKTPPPRLHDLQPGIEFGGLEAIVARALAKSADDRYANAEEFAAALDIVPRRRTATPIAGIAVTGGAIATPSGWAVPIDNSTTTPGIGVPSNPTATPASGSSGGPDGGPSGAPGGPTHGVASSPSGPTGSPSPHEIAPSPSGPTVTPRVGTSPSGPATRPSAPTHPSEPSIDAPLFPNAGKPKRPRVATEPAGESLFSPATPSPSAQEPSAPAPLARLANAAAANSPGLDPRFDLSLAIPQAPASGIIEASVAAPVPIAEPASRPATVAFLGAPPAGPSPLTATKDADPEPPDMFVPPVRPGRIVYSPVQYPFTRKQLAIAGGGVVAVVIIIAIIAGARGGSRTAATPIDAASAVVVAPPPPANPVDDQLARANAMISEGRTEPALQLLISARRVFPDDARLAYLTGKLYFGKMWWRDGIKQFRDTLTLDPGYRTDPELIRIVLKGFITPTDYPADLGSFLRNDIGPPARSFLEETAADHPNRNVRARAAAELRRFP